VDWQRQRTSGVPHWLDQRYLFWRQGFPVMVWGFNAGGCPSSWAFEPSSRGLMAALAASVRPAAALSDIFGATPLPYRQHSRHRLKCFRPIKPARRWGLHVVSGFRSWAYVCCSSLPRSCTRHWRHHGGIWGASAAHGEFLSRWCSQSARGTASVLWHELPIARAMGHPTS
jgi:hypothetical protein